MGRQRLKENTHKKKKPHSETGTEKRLFFFCKALKQKNKNNLIFKNSKSLTFYDQHAVKYYNSAVDSSE